MVPALVLILVLVLVVFPLWALLRILALGKDNEALGGRVTELERDLQLLRHERASTPPAAAASTAPTSAPVAANTAIPPSPLVPPVAPVVAARPSELAPEISPPSPLVPPALPVAVPVTVSAAPEPTFSTPPALPPRALPPRINWEQFMGAKLFAWLGGLAAFLGAVFFVKYSFEHDLIPPEVRVALGYLFALGLVGGGLKIGRGRYAVTSQTLVATGVVCLYGVTFACNSIYHFAFFETAATFLTMTLITAAAFVLAVRLDGRVIAVLGIFGGFLTPWLLSTGRDNPGGLFGYVALLDLGLIAVALQRRWHFLVPLGAAGTLILELGWAVKFFHATRASVAITVALVFCALFLAAYFVARRLGRLSAEVRWSAVAFPFSALALAGVFLGYPEIAARPGLLFSFVLAADLCLLALAWCDEELPRLHLVAGLAVFALLAAWTGGRLTNELLPWALAFYLLHAVLHTAFPLVLERRRPAAAPAWWSQLFPPLTLLLLLGPMLKLDTLSLAFWPCVLLVDLLAIAFAWFAAALTGVALVLALTLVVTGVWIFHVPVAADDTAALLGVIGGFALLFFTAGIFLARRLGEEPGSRADAAGGLFGDARGQIPACSALLPFLLLVMMTQRLPLANPSPVFGLALLLVGLTLGLACALTLEWLPACALTGVAALEYAWRARHPSVDHVTLTLGWYVAFAGVFALFPFVFRRRFASLTGPWAIAALAGVLQFPLVYRLLEHTGPRDARGLIPALFALPPLLSLLAIARGRSGDERARLNQLAWFGGVALWFITLIFPIQFERQWLTLGWALEGVALLWLFRRVPHPGLRATGVALLVAAFARLALNPAVLEYHARSLTPIFNWYLYSYGLVTAALFLGVRLVDRPHAAGAAPVTIFGVPARALLGTLGTVLAFLLLNLEIADFFSVPGARVLTFELSGSFARDMSYTIAWALFALALLLLGLARRLRAAIYAAWALLGVALLKLFFHDLARLEALYRIGALFALAVVGFIASFAYQRFQHGEESGAPEKP